MKKRGTAIVLSLLVMFFLMSGLTASAKADKVYQIGTDVTYPPFEFANDQNKYVGIDIDLMNAIAKKEGFKVNIKPIGFNAAVQSLESGQIDGVMAGMAITPVRRQTFDFSKPYYKTGVIIAVAKDSKIKSFRQLRGKKSSFENRYSCSRVCTVDPS